MKVKEVSRTANVAWSPQGMQAIHLACGTVAQQLDATFSTSAKVEIFSLDLGTPGPEMTLVGAIDTPNRFHKLVWSGHGMGEDHPKGLLIGGSDNGIITVWSADRIIKSGSDSTVATISQHTGTVRSLDVNPFQPNLLASGASESEIFIWDLNNPATPMSPGSKTHPLEDISGVAWNQQVQHILASTSPGGRSVVWDLRKNEPIIQVADTSSRVQCSGIAWHPDVATQLVTSSVDDRSPIIQMWDLRYATAPMRVLDQHKRGILSLAWCRQDSDLLLSAAKDNRVLCWNPNSETPGGEVVYELPATSQWIFECQWCPRNPSIISTASFDGHVTMYSLLGGGGGAQGAEPGAEQAPAPPPPSGGSFFDGVTPQVAPRSSVVESAPLKTPPKWFRRPCGARFAFGGKLVSFSNTRGAGVPKTVAVSQVVTEQDFLRRSCDLEQSLSEGKLAEFCEGKAGESTDSNERNMWSFLKVTFEDNPRRQYLKLLGYDLDELEKKFSTWSKMRVSTLPAAGGLDVTELSQRLATIPSLPEQEGGAGGGEGSQDEMNAGSENSSTAAIYGSEVDRQSVQSGLDSLSLNESSSTQASKRVSNASFLGVPATPPSSVSSSFSIPTDRDTDGMLSQALLVGNFEAAVDICISADRMAEAMVLAVAGGSDLLKRTQQVFFSKKPGKVTKLMSAVVNRNWTEVARHGDLDNWREILAALVTYAGPEDFAPLCDLLGGRLERESDAKYRSNASLCYICSGNVEKFVESLSESTNEQTGGSCSPLVLQDMMEKIVLLKRAVEQQRKQYDSAHSQTLNEKLRQYASLLASQGCLSTAYGYLLQDTESNGAILKDRLYQAQGLTSTPRPEFPFSTVDTTTAVPAQNTATKRGNVPVVGGAGGVVNQGVGVVNQPDPNVATSPFARNRMPMGVGGGYAGGMGGAISEGGSIPSATLSSHTGVSSSLSNTTIYNPLNPMNMGHAHSPAGTTPSPNTYRTSEGAWNDPPTITAKAPPPSTSQPNMVPITRPITTPLEQVPPQANQHQPHGAPAIMEVTNQPSPSPVQKAPPPAVVEKRPIPEEYSVMVQAFEGMMGRCRPAATNLGTRKKLDDIERKLSVLYDLLRDFRVSDSVIQGLNYMAQSANNRDYRSGLSCYNQMVSSGNFSEISGFMPGIKTLLNLGIQLRV